MNKRRIAGLRGAITQARRMVEANREDIRMGHPFEPYLHDNLDRLGRLERKLEKELGQSTGWYVACVRQGEPVAHYVSSWSGEQTPEGPNFATELTTDPRRARVFAEERHARSASTLANMQHMGTVGVFGVRSVS